MPNVYTRSGDKGTTGLFGGSRTPKNDIRVEAYGTTDEANASIGFAKSIISDQEMQDILDHIQHRIFVLGAELASNDKGKEMLTDKISEDDVKWLEDKLDHYLDIVGKQTQFVIPGENPPSGALHVARTIVRRAERRIIDYADQEAVRPELVKYVNRLSDLLFVLARTEDYNHTVKEVTKKVEEYLGKVDLAGEAGKVNSDKTDINMLTLVKRIAQASRVQAAKMNVPIVFAAVDKHGNLMYLERQADSLLASIDIAQKKANTAAALKAPTHVLGDLSKEEGPLFGLHTIDGGKYIVFGGGFPLIVNDEIIGAIGVSGGTAEEDMEIAKAGLAIV